MKVLWVGILTLVSQAAFAVGGPWKVEYQSLKPPANQALMEHQTWALPIAGASTVLKSGGALNNGSVTSVTTFAAQPDYPRNITIGFGGSTGSVATGTAVVTGTSILGGAITESYSITSGALTSTGTKAFASVTNVLLPATSSSGATVFIGVGNKLGLKRCATRAGDYVFSEFNSAYETTRGTLAVSSSAVESNTFVPNGTMDGLKQVDLFYVQNYSCF